MTSSACTSPAGHRPTQNGQYVSYSAPTSICDRRESVPRCCSIARASDPRAWRPRRVRRVRHLSSLGHPRRQRGRRLLRRMDAVRIRSLQRGDRRGGEPRRGRDLRQARPRPGPVVSRHEPFVLSGPKIRRFNGPVVSLWYIAGRKWKTVDGRPSRSTGYGWRLSRRRHALGPASQDLIPGRSRTTKPGESRRHLRQRQVPHVLLLPVQQWTTGAGKTATGSATRVGRTCSTWTRDDAQRGHRRLRTRAGTPR